jgi:small-conductance mechanosensitive channel
MLRSILRNRERIRVQSARARQVRVAAVDRARGAKREAVVLAALVTAVLAAYNYRSQLFGLDLPVRIASALILVVLGWALARAVGRAAGPALMGRLDSRTAGTAGFLVRLTAMTATVVVAVDLVGLRASALVTGGAITAVVLGLAAQQTLGNVIAGIMVASAHPFAVGDRIRLRSGNLAGEVEGTVTALGLLYTELAAGDDRIMIPNNTVLASVVVPLREPAAVDLVARLRPGIKPSRVQDLLEQAITTPTRTDPHVGLEEVDSDEVVVRIAAKPERDEDGARLADEVLAALNQLTQHGEHAVGNGR